MPAHEERARRGDVHEGERPRVAPPLDARLPENGYPGEYLLDLAGLALVDMYGDYDLGPLTSDSERMIAIARRKNG